MSESKRLLAVLAHPDDESFGMGGTLAYYAARGVDVYLVCATRGEVGEVDEEFMQGFETIAELREHELRCASETLGITNVYFLDYRDSGMKGSPDNDHPNALAAQPLEDVAEKIVGYIRKLKPQVVVTFDPVGGYHHPDHIAIHDATVIAFEAAGDRGRFPEMGEPFQPKKLYYHIFPRKFVRFIVWVMKLFGVNTTQFGRNKDINLDVIAGDADYPQHITVNYKQYMEQRNKASECHASQLDFGRQSPSLVSWFRKLSGGKDYYMRAYPQTADRYRARDLFGD